MSLYLVFLCFWVSIMFSSGVMAQSAGDSDLALDSLEVEALYDRLDEDESQTESQDSEGGGSAGETPKEVIEKISKKDMYQSIGRASELSRLAPFKDVAVISKKYLPKSHRFEFSTGALFVLNNVFFNGYGYFFKGAFYLSEKWGLEGRYYNLSSSERQLTSELEDHRQISTRSLVDPTGFVGGGIKWAPIYGKMSLFEKKIIPFDVSFSLGYGLTDLKAKYSQGKVEKFDGVETVYFSAGQKFAINKSVALRWDMGWNIYSVEINRVDSAKESLSHVDLYFGIGLSAFFPGARSR